MKDSSVEQRYEKLLKSGDAVAKILNGKGNDDDIMEALSEFQPETEDTDFMEDYIPTKEDLELERNPTPIYAQIDPYSGKINNVINDNIGNIYDKNLDELLGMDQERIRSDVDINEDAIQESVKSIFPNLEITDFKMFMSALNRYRKGEKFSYYNALPQSMKDQVDLIIGNTYIGYTSNKEARAYVVQGVFDQVINDNYTNKLFVNIEQSMNESFKELYDNTKGQFSEYNNNFRDMIENRLQLEAENIKDTDPEKAMMYQDISNAFVRSYTFDEMYDLYVNTGKLKVKPIMVDKFKRTCDEWCLKYKDHKMIINNVYDLLPALQSMFTGYGFDDKIYKKFICVFINYTKNMKPDNISEHVFMYYFIKNILGIVYCNTEDEQEVKFCLTVKDNVNKFLTAIKEKEENK